MMPFPAGPWCKSVLRRLSPSAVLFGLALPAVAQEAPLALFTTTPNPAEGGAPLTVQFIDQSTGTITSWLWDFGDGGPGSTLQNPVNVFTLVQPYDVTLTVSGPLGSNSLTLLHAVDVLPTTNGVAGAPPALSSMVVPMPDDLGDFIADMDAARLLGKALFWDMQLGSDGMTACASCHYHAGADNRVRNTLHPGADGVFDVLASGRGGGPNYALNSGDFPFHKFVDANNGEDLIASTDDRRGTAGVLSRAFVGSDDALQFDLFKELSDATFQVNEVKTLRVTGRDAPTAIGAIFFHRLFWDGRANHFFNGRNIWGNSDPSRPTVLERRPDGSLGEVAILLEDAAAASQAIGPPLSDTEMSWTGRSWPDLGRKMVDRRPLASQHVELSDGVLGTLANPAGPGLRPDLTYADLIRDAFQERWWGSGDLDAQGFTQMEANFSLFFGLAILVHEATLVPGNAPYDRWAAGDLGAMDEAQVRGLNLFVGRAGCINCHGTPLFAGALRDEVRTPDAEAEGALESMPMATAFLTGGLTFSFEPRMMTPDRRAAGLYGPDGTLLAWTRLPAGLRCGPAGRQVFALQPSASVPPGSGFLAELRTTTDGRCGLTIDFRFQWNEGGLAADTYQLRIAGRSLPLVVNPATRVAVYDNGFYNIGVTPTSVDLGVGAEGPFGPLSFARRVQNGEDIGHRAGVEFVAWHQRVAVDGAFKTPTLRNVELTGPYMHDGSMASLEQVVEFYARGGNFAAENADDLDPDVGGIQAMTEQDKADLVAFLKALTDPRVRFEQAPFDRPELILKEGQVGDHQSVFSDGAGNAIPALVYKPATGFTGGAPLATFAERLPAFVTAALIEEDAFGARIGFVCDKQPLANVNVLLSLSNPALATLSSNVVTFTPADWRVGRVVTVTTVDPDAAGGTSLTVHTSKAQSTDPNFAGLVVDDVVLDFLPIVTRTSTPGTTATSSAPGGAASVGRKP